ncbi:MAG: type 4a pilus biogenesis protein PilO [Pirellulales bacterium]
MNDRLKKLDMVLHGGGLAVVLSSFGVAWILVYQPLESARVEAEARCAEINEHLGSADGLRREHAQLEHSLADARHQEQRLLARVPDEAREAEFLSQMSRLAKDVGMELRDYRPGQVQSQATCSAMEVALTCEGPYESLCRFLDGVGRLPRLVHLSHLEINGSQSGSSYSATLKLVIYFGAAANSSVPERKEPHG